MTDLLWRWYGRVLLKVDESGAGGAAPSRHLGLVRDRGLRQLPEGGQQRGKIESQ